MFFIKKLIRFFIWSFKLFIRYLSRQARLLFFSAVLNFYNWTIIALYKPLRYWFIALNPWNTWKKTWWLTAFIGELWDEAWFRVDFWMDILDTIIWEILGLLVDSAYLLFMELQPTLVDLLKYLEDSSLEFLQEAEIILVEIADSNLESFLRKHGPTFYLALRAAATIPLSRILDRRSKVENSADLLTFHAETLQLELLEGLLWYYTAVRNSPSVVKNLIFYKTGSLTYGGPVINGLKRVDSFFSKVADYFHIFLSGSHKLRHPILDFIIKYQYNNIAAYYYYYMVFNSILVFREKVRLWFKCVERLAPSLKIGMRRCLRIFLFLNKRILILLFIFLLRGQFVTFAFIRDSLLNNYAASTTLKKITKQQGRVSKNSCFSTKIYKFKKGTLIVRKWPLNLFKQVPATLWYPLKIIKNNKIRLLYTQSGYNDTIQYYTYKNRSYLSGKKISNLIIPRLLFGIFSYNLAGAVTSVNTSQVLLRKKPTNRLWLFGFIKHGSSAVRGLKNLVNLVNSALKLTNIKVKEAKQLIYLVVSTPTLLTIFYTGAFIFYLELINTFNRKLTLPVYICITSDEVTNSELLDQNLWKSATGVYFLIEFELHSLFHDHVVRGLLYFSQTILFSNRNPTPVNSFSHLFCRFLNFVEPDAVTNFFWPIDPERVADSLFSISAKVSSKSKERSVIQLPSRGLMSAQIKNSSHRSGYAWPSKSQKLTPKGLPKGPSLRSSKPVKIAYPSYILEDLRLNNLTTSAAVAKLSVFKFTKNSVAAWIFINLPQSGFFCASAIIGFIFIVCGLLIPEVFHIFWASFTDWQFVGSTDLGVLNVNCKNQEPFTKSIDGVGNQKFLFLENYPIWNLDCKSSECFLKVLDPSRGLAYYYI